MDQAISNFISPLKITTKPRTYPEVGQCIYCTVIDGQLTDEHIVPFGIAGNSLVLPRASCLRCAKVTSKIENACLRHMWWPFRTRIGAPTSKPKHRPDDFTLRRAIRLAPGQFEPLENFQILSEHFPLFFIALKLRPPGILDGRLPTDSLEGEIWARMKEEEIRPYISGNQEAMFLAPVNPTTFCRMLAKIAHAYAVAEVGYNNFKPMLKKLIRGKSLTPNYWVGGDWEIPQSSSEHILHDINHSLAHKNGRTFVIVSLRLFAFFETPQYHIVAGEI